MGLFDTPKTKVINLEPFPEAGKLSKQLTEAAIPGAMERLQMAGQAYPGQLTAGMSQYEQTGLQNLEDYLSSPTPMNTSLYGAAQSELEKTLAGEYDPIGGEYYKAYKTAVMRELQEAKDRLAAETSARDKYFGGGRIAASGELEESATNELALVLGQLAENERNRRLQAATMTTDFLGAGEGLEQGRIAASQELGALPRELEQTELTARYNEWIRQMTDLGLPLETAIALLTQKADAVASTEQGGFWTALQALGPAIGAGIGGYYGARV